MDEATATVDEATATVDEATATVDEATATLDAATTTSTTAVNDTATATVDAVDEATATVDEVSDTADTSVDQLSNTTASVADAVDAVTATADSVDAVTATVDPVDAVTATMDAVDAVTAMVDAVAAVTATVDVVDAATTTDEVIGAATPVVDQLSDAGNLCGRHRGHAGSLDRRYRVELGLRGIGHDHGCGVRRGGLGRSVRREPDGRRHRRAQGPAALGQTQGRQLPDRAIAPEDRRRKRALRPTPPRERARSDRTESASVLTLADGAEAPRWAVHATAPCSDPGAPRCSPTSGTSEEDSLADKIREVIGLLALTGFAFLPWIAAVLALTVLGSVALERARGTGSRARRVSAA